MPRMNLLMYYNSILVALLKKVRKQDSNHVIMYNVDHTEGGIIYFCDLTIYTHHFCVGEN